MSNKSYSLYQRNALAKALAIALSLGATSAAFAQDAEEKEQDKSKEAQITEIDRVQVVGSRIARAQQEGPSPVTIISREQIDAQGHVTVYDVLNSLTMQSTSVQNDLFQNGFTPNAQVLNFRGLGPAYTLVLINGRRAADYPLPYNGQSNFVNIGNIPSGAVERIEILSGGASAIYGSDAVAGVVNIVMRTHFEGDQLTVKMGAPTEGGAETYDIQWAGGKTGDNWNLTYTMQYFDRGTIYAQEREFMDSYRDNPNPALRTPITGLYIQALTGPGSTISPVGTQPYYGFNADTVCPQFSWYEPYTFTGTSGATTFNRGRACGFWEYPMFQSIRNGAENLSAYLYGTMDFENGLQAYASVSGWDSSAVVASTVQFWQPTYYDITRGGVNRLLRIFTPQESNGFEGLDRAFTEQSYDVAFGLRGTFADQWDWDATISHSAYDSLNERPRLLISELNNMFFFRNPGDPTVVGGREAWRLNVNAFTTPLTFDQFRQLNTTVVTDANSSVSQGTFVVTNSSLFEMPAGDVGFAAVIEGGKQEYELIADSRILPSSPPTIYNLTGTGGGGERDRYAFGVEFSIPLLSTLTATAASRYDKYDDITEVDDAVTYSFGLQYRPIDSVLVRSSFATSFRAPDMHFVFAERSGSFSTIKDEFLCRSAGLTIAACPNNTTYQYSAFGVRQGNAFLEEENGESIGFGVVWDITDNLSLTVDAYRVELEGQVADISSAFVLENEANCRLGVDRAGAAVDPSSAACIFWLGSVSRDPTSPTRPNGITEIRRGPINRAFLGQDGIDATLDYKHSTDNWGSFLYRASYTHTLDNKTAQFATDPILSNRDDRGNFDARARFGGTISWLKGDWMTTLVGNRMSSLPTYEMATTTSATPRSRTKPWILYNLTTSYALTENFGVTLIANNVLNKLPPNDNTYTAYPYFWRAYNPIGRELFVKLDYKF